MVFFFFFKQKTAYEMRISDWSSDVCSSDLQGATDLGLDVTSLPLYYGLTEAAWKHWARVWDVDYEWFQGRFDEVPAKGGRKARSRKENMETPGITSTRWFDATLLPEEQIAQKRSEERRVGKECASTCRSGWSPDN